MATRATTLWSLSVVRDWFAGTGSLGSADKDTEIERIADSASEFLENETGWKFVDRELDEIYNGDGSRLLRLRNGPLPSSETIITLLTILRDEDDASPDTILSTAYHVDKERRILRLKTHKDAVDPFTRGFQNVRAKYNVGFGIQDAVTLPADIVRAGLDLSKYMWTEWTTGAIAASQISIGPGNIFLKPDLPLSVKQVIDRWRIPVVA